MARDINGNYYINNHEMKRAQGLILVGNETFPVADEGKYIFQVMGDRAGYCAPSDVRPGTEADAEAEKAGWLECYPDADCRVVEIS